MQSPRELAEQRMQLADNYAKLGERLTAIRLQKATEWPRLREEAKSNVEADRAWEVSELGREELEIKMKMKTTEYKLSALRTLLEVRQNELKDLY